MHCMWPPHLFQPWDTFPPISLNPGLRCMSVPSQSGFRYHRCRHYRFCRFEDIRDGRGLGLILFFKLLNYPPFQFLYSSYGSARNSGDKELLIGSLTGVYPRFAWEEFSNSGFIESNWLGSCKVKLPRWFWCADLVKHLLPCGTLSLVLKLLIFCSSLSPNCEHLDGSDHVLFFFEAYLMVFVEETGSSSAAKAKASEC